MSFAARFPGRCGQCGEPFEIGTGVQYNDDDVLVTADCAAPDAIEQLDVDKHGVMPRGKTAADTCKICFQIRSSNETCGCS